VQLPPGDDHYYGVIRADGIGRGILFGFNLSLDRLGLLMEILSKHRLAALACAVLVLAGAGLLVLRQPGFLNAQTDGSKWKSFSETRFGLSLDYPQSWSFDVGYDRYAKGLINVDIVNKKCGAGACAAGCVDVRVFAGGKPDNGSSQLFIQLYEDMLAVKDTDNPELVQKIDIDEKTVYKILNEQPTLSLNGTCAGPLYVFDAGNGNFVYVFAGYGAQARPAGEETVRQIISSLSISK
jgi:hypothetical protein